MASQDLPSEFEVIVVGTGLEESMIAACLARNGHTVLHIDTNNYYGGEWAAFNFDGIQEWITSHKQNLSEDNSSVVENKDANNELDNEKRKEFESFLNEGERLCINDSNKIKSCISDVEQQWHISDEIECNSDIASIKESGLACASNEATLQENVPASTDMPIEEEEQVSETTKESTSSATTAMPNPSAVGKEETSDKKNRKRWNRKKIFDNSRKFNLDLIPRLLYSRGAMVELLISSNISRYTEFKSVSRVLTKMATGSLEHVPSSRADVFATKHVTVVEKRILMKYMNFCVNYESQPEVYENFVGKTYLEFLKHERLTQNLIHFVLHSIAMADESTPCLQGLKSTKKFLSSLGRFGNTPFLWSMYGSGELPQAFCRLCAVFGGTYYLGKSVEAFVLKSNNVEGIITNGQRISCKHLVMNAAHCPQSLRKEHNIPHEEVTLNRKICLLSDSILPSEKEQLTFISLPSESNEREPNKAITTHTFVQEVGFGPAACPRGMYVLHTTSRQFQDIPESNHIDVNSILKKDVMLWSLSFKLRSQRIVQSTTDASSVRNLYLCNGPCFELDYDLAIENARTISSRMYPGEDFIPRAPDPEEILIGGEENETTETVPNETVTQAADEQPGKLECAENQNENKKPANISEDQDQSAT